MAGRGAEPIVDIEVGVDPLGGNGSAREVDDFSPALRRVIVNRAVNPIAKSEIADRDDALGPFTDQDVMPKTGAADAAAGTSAGARGGGSTGQRIGR